MNDRIRFNFAEHFDDQHDRRSADTQLRYLVIFPANSCAPALTFYECNSMLRRETQMSWRLRSRLEPVPDNP